MPGAPSTLPDSEPPDGVPGAWLVRGLSLFVTAALPVFLVLTGVRLVMSEAFLTLEYTRPGFPADRFGFTQAERRHYAPFAVRYLLTDVGIDYLGDLTFPDGQPLFGDKELRHMQDVKTVTRAALRVHMAVSAALAAAAIALAWQRTTRPILRRSLASGGIFTILMVALLAILILASWDLFFDGFHHIFFEGDSWQFSTSDTLIRLFPEQFWFDAALAIGLFTVLGATASSLGVWLWERRAARHSRRMETVTFQR